MRADVRARVADPPLKPWAIFGRPFGTQESGAATHDLIATSAHFVTVARKSKKT
jgi:hypothetical protein